MVPRRGACSRGADPAWHPPRLVRAQVKRYGQEEEEDEERGDPGTASWLPPG